MNFGSAPARLADTAVVMAYLGRLGPPEDNVKLGEPEGEAVGVIDEDHIERVSKSLGESSCQFQTAESGSRDHDVHSRTIPEGQTDGRA
ncbi:MAG: hypothetical protein LH645_06520 [Actinomycetia bacterium]|nr:hypothetical protein [Actinomycetes bacterium]